MGNGVKIAAKQGEDKNFCDGSLDDVEICERGVDSIWSVDDDGEPLEHLENYSGEAFYAYYNCNACGEAWDILESQGQEIAFNKVKEHFRES